VAGPLRGNGRVFIPVKRPSCGKGSAFLAAMAFSSEVDTGSREENASIQSIEPGFDSSKPEKL